MFGRKCDSGMHFLQIEFPHGRVTGSTRGYEHSGHCASRTICLASLDGSSGEVMVTESKVGGLGGFEGACRSERWELSGREDINANISRTGKWSVDGRFEVDSNQSLGMILVELK